MANSPDLGKLFDRFTSTAAAAPTLISGALAIGGAMLGQELNVFATYGVFGFFLAAVIFFLAISLAFFVFVYAFRKLFPLPTPRKPKSTIPPNQASGKVSALERLWPTLVVAAAIIGAAYIFKSRVPALPYWATAGASHKIRLPLATARDMSQDKIEGKTVYLSLMPVKTVHQAGVLGRSIIISDKQFVNCDVRGPGVLVMERCNLVSNAVLSPYGLTLDSHLLIMTTNYVVGGIPVHDCNFVRCNFVDLAFAIPPDMLENTRRGFGWKK